MGKILLQQDEEFQTNSELTPFQSSIHVTEQQNLLFGLFFLASYLYLSWLSKGQVEKFYLDAQRVLESLP